MTQVYGIGYWSPGQVTNVNCASAGGGANCDNSCVSGMQTGVWYDNTWSHDTVDCLSLNPAAGALAGLQPRFTEWDQSYGQNPTTTLGESPAHVNTSARQKYTYYAEDFQTLDQVRAFQYAYQNDKYYNPDFSTNFDIIMINFCALQTTNCPNSSIFGQTLYCSNLRDGGDTGDFCRAWFLNTTDANRDLVGQNYCTKYNTDECQCLNRLKNPIYRAAAATASITDCCWWIPCKNPSNNFVPSNMDPCTTCPSNICESIVETYDSSNIHFNNVSQYISCPGINNGPNPTPSNPSSDTTSTILFTCIIIVLIIVIVMVIPITRTFILGHLLIVSIIVGIIVAIVALYIYEYVIGGISS